MNNLEPPVVDTTIEPATASPAPVVESTPTLSKDASPEEVLRFNPFAPKGANAAPDSGKQGAVTPAKIEGQVPPANLVPNAPAQSNQPDANVEAIRNVLFQNQLPVAQTPVAVTPEQNPFQVNWDVPDQVMAAITSQDPAESQLGMRTLVNGVANGVLQIAQQQMEALLTTAIPQMLARRDQAADLNRTFYTAYPHLNKPELAETVGRVASALAQSYRAQGRAVNPIDPAFMGAVENYIVSQGFVARPQAAPVPAPYFGSNGSAPRVPAQQEAPDFLSQIGL